MDIGQIYTRFKPAVSYAIPPDIGEIEIRSIKQLHCLQLLVGRSQKAVPFDLIFQSQCTVKMDYPKVCKSKIVIGKSKFMECLSLQQDISPGQTIVTCDPIRRIEVHCCRKSITPSVVKTKSIQCTFSIF